MDTRLWETSVAMATELDCCGRVQLDRIWRWAAAYLASSPEERAEVRGRCEAAALYEEQYVWRGQTYGGSPGCPQWGIPREGFGLPESWFVAHEVWSLAREERRPDAEYVRDHPYKVSVLGWFYA